jgi:hypothetical protein
MTQKEAIKNIVETFDDRRLAYQFIFNWLEDINWHRENTILSEQLNKHDFRYLDALERLYQATHQGNYAHQYIVDLLANDLELAGALVDIENKRVAFYRGYRFDSEHLHEFDKTQFYRAFNYIWGWGITTADWVKTSGPEFVDEVIELVEPIFKEKAAYDKAMRGY